MPRDVEALEQVLTAFDRPLTERLPSVRPTGPRWSPFTTRGFGASRCRMRGRPVARREQQREYLMTSTDDISGPTDHAMTRSEERLRVDTRRRVSGRTRVQKFVTTETVTIEVEVRREEVRLVHDPAGDGDLGAEVGESYGDARQEPAREEIVLVLHEERPVVTKEVVPVERVRVVVEEVTTTETASDEVRAEHIELERDGVTGTTSR